MSAELYISSQRKKEALMDRIDPSFGLEMKRLREAKGISQRKLAELVGLDSGYISRIERGLFKPPSEEKIKAISEVLGANSDFMLSLCGKVSSEITDAVKKQPEKMAEVVKSVDRASAGDIVMLLIIGLALLIGKDKNDDGSDKETDWTDLKNGVVEAMREQSIEEQKELVGKFKWLFDNIEHDLFHA